MLKKLPFSTIWLYYMCRDLGHRLGYCWSNIYHNYHDGFFLFGNFLTNILRLSNFCHKIAIKSVYLKPSRCRTTLPSPTSKPLFRLFKAKKIAFKETITQDFFIYLSNQFTFSVKDRLLLVRPYLR